MASNNVKLEIIRKAAFILLPFFILACFVALGFVLICFGSCKMRLTVFSILHFILNGYFINNMTINVGFFINVHPNKPCFKLGLWRQKKVRHNFCFQRVLKHLVPWGETSQMVFVLRIAEFEGLVVYLFKWICRKS